MEDLRGDSRGVSGSGKLLSVSILMLEIGDIASLGFFALLAFAGCLDTLSIGAFALDFLFLLDFSLFPD